MSELVLQFSSTPAWQSGIIRRVCHSPFSHVDIVLSTGELLGASDPGGVMVRKPAYEEFTIKRRAYIQTLKAPDIIATAMSQVGKPFDSDAIHAFLAAGETHVPRDWRDPNKWFCAELVTWAMEKNTFWPYKLMINEDCVSPPDLLLLLNPYVDPEAFWMAI